MTLCKLKDNAKRLYYKGKHLKRCTEGYVSYSKFMSNPCKYRRNKVVLQQKDFDEGTLRITKPAYYILKENIHFGPNPDNNFKPKPEQTKYSGKAFVLGFFAAITVETNEFTVIDLNDKTLEQTREFSYHQRFFNLIELNDQPFVPKEGPANFGDTLVAAENLVIWDGKLGLSSHSGIHGNGNKNVLTYKVKFEDYELAAITLNGAKDVYTVKCKAKGNRKDLAVNGPFNSALFLLEFAKRSVPYGTNNSLDTHNLENAIQSLQLLVDSVFADLKVGNTLNNPDANDLFGNPQGLLDGQGYGFLVNAFGVAVNGFMTGRDHPRANDSKNVLFYDCKAEKGYYDVTEVLALWDNLTNKPQTGTTGNLFDVMKVTNENGAYSGNALSNLEVYLAQLRDQLPEEIQGHFGTLNINKKVQDWALLGNTTMQEMLSSGDFSIKRNGDHQFHVMKGCVGFRMDGLENGCFEKCKVKDFRNVGPAGNRQSFMGDTGYNYTGANDGGHPASGSQKGYNGSDAYGFCLSACKNLEFSKVCVYEIKSENGDAVGFGVQNQTDDVYACDLHSKKNDGLTVCTALRVGEGCNNIVLNLNASN